MCVVTYSHKKLIYDILPPQKQMALVKGYHVSLDQGHEWSPLRSNAKVRREKKKDYLLY